MDQNRIRTAHLRMEQAARLAFHLYAPNTAGAATPQTDARILEDVRGLLRSALDLLTETCPAILVNTDRADWGSKRPCGNKAVTPAGYCRRHDRIIPSGA